MSEIYDGTRRCDSMISLSVCLKIFYNKTKKLTIFKKYSIIYKFDKYFNLFFLTFSKTTGETKSKNISHIRYYEKSLKEININFWHSLKWVPKTRDSRTWVPGVQDIRPKNVDPKTQESRSRIWDTWTNCLIPILICFEKRKR